MLTCLQAGGCDSREPGPVSDIRSPVAGAEGGVEPRQGWSSEGHQLHQPRHTRPALPASSRIPIQHQQCQPHGSR